MGRPGPLPVRCGDGYYDYDVHHARDAARVFCRAGPGRGIRDVAYYCYKYDMFWCAWVVIRQEQLSLYEAFLANRLGCIIQYDALCKCRVKALVPLWV